MGSGRPTCVGYLDAGHLGITDDLLKEVLPESRVLSLTSAIRLKIEQWPDFTAVIEALT